MQYPNVNWGRWPFIFCIAFIFCDDDDDDDASLFSKRNYKSTERYYNQLPRNRLSTKTNIVANISRECMSSKTNHKTNYHSPFHWNDWRPYYCKSHPHIDIQRSIEIEQLKRRTCYPRKSRGDPQAHHVEKVLDEVKQRPGRGKVSSELLQESIKILKPHKNYKQQTVLKTRIAELFINRQSTTVHIR